MAAVANRYVNALLDSAKSKEDDAMFEKGLKEIANLFSSDENFKNILMNPRVETEEKLDVIKEIFPEYNNEVFVKFLAIIIDEKRINIIEDISDKYSECYNLLNKELKIKIITAMKLEEEQITEIVNKYKDLYKVDVVKYDLEIDETILGGIKVVVGNKVYDSSVKTQIEEIF